METIKSALLISLLAIVAICLLTLSDGKFDVIIIGSLTTFSWIIGKETKD